MSDTSPRNLFFRSLLEWSKPFLDLDYLSFLIFLVMGLKFSCFLFSLLLFLWPWVWLSLYTACVHGERPLLGMF